MIFTTVADFDAALNDLPRADETAIAAARARQAELTKPAGSLGRLEEIAIHFAGWQGRSLPKLDNCHGVVFAGNHGVAAQGVSAFPMEVTAQMVTNFGNGGAAINALCYAAGVELHVVPLELDRPTADFTHGPAMSEEECLAALSAGAAVVTSDMDLLLTGEMGIGNTTPASALCARSFGGDVAEWVGPGSGVSSSCVTHKVKVIETALALHGSAPDTAFETLRRLGGREIAAMAGAILRARQLRVPVVLDGFICCAAIAPLVKVAPTLTDHCIAGHSSAEPGHIKLLDQFGLSPLLLLDMRLGEGSGAATAVPLIRSAIMAHNRMATFAEAGVAAGL